MRKKIILTIGILATILLAIFFVRLGPLLFQLLFNRNIELKRTDHATNILLLGIAGGRHAGPELSDTVIYAHIDEARNEVVLVSIPRDLWIPELTAKINTAYAFGEEKDGKGILLSRAVVGKVIGREIDYTIVGDFEGFKKLSDMLGGININVKRSVDDYEYPITGAEDDPCGHTEEELVMLATAPSQLEAFPCRYKLIHFDKGLQQMNGERALEFMRSRNAKGEEGTDFARSQRQQQVILAVKDKMFSLGTIFNPVKVIGISNVLKGNIRTDIKEGEIDDFIKLAQKMKGTKIMSFVIDAGDEKQKRSGLLLNPQISKEYGYQWVLIPRRGNGDYSEIKEYVDCIEKGNECEVGEKGIEVKSEDRR